MSQFTKLEIAKFTEEEFIAEMQAQYQNYKDIFEESLFEMKYDNFVKTGELITNKERLFLYDIEAFVKRDHADEGACCSGQSIEVKVNDLTFLFAKPIAQGNVTNEIYFDLIKKIFTDRKFRINFGNMM
jgi:hypothetical protein